MSLTRRSFCLTGTAALSSIAFAAPDAQRARRTESRRYFGGFRVGLQSASLANLSLEQLIAKVKGYGLKYLELSPAHLDFAAASTHDVRGVRVLLLDVGLSTPSYGVAELKVGEQKHLAGIPGTGVLRGRSTAALDPIFERAQEFGIRTLVVDTDLRSIAELDRFAGRFRLEVAIHNRLPAAPGAGAAELATADAVLGALKGRSAWCGAALDTGNLLAAGQDPIKAVESLKDAITDIHLCDVSKAGAPCPLGQGMLNVTGFFDMLAKHDYDGPIMVKYQGTGGGPEAAVDSSFEYLRKATAGN